MSTRRPLRAQRQESLLAELRRHGGVRVSDIARELSVSELTVRRDIDALAKRNLVTKVHGGATLPSSVVRPALSKQSRAAFTIGMVVPSLDFYWPLIVGGARAAAAALGVQLQLRGSSYDPDEDRRQITRLIEAKQVQGLLLAPSLDGARADEMIDWIGRLPVPTILVERQPERWTPTTRQIECVRSDHALGLEMAVHHLYERGHRRMALLLSKGSPTSAYLLRGWKFACADLDIPDAVVFRESVAFTAPGHRAIIDRILDECAAARITAVIIHSDPDAIAFAQFCAEKAIAVPDDLALVSYDDEVAHLAEPSLTAVRPAKTHVGRAAVELMVSRLLDGERRPTQRILVAPELIVRQSSIGRGLVK
ncbi:LacI family DNA-binding transcriptional regulator [Catellatospora paridis]|uniref:LacI family DNA-binding transcriptional regulator n=1 Tax=Catellatospora paridis TaxID=1617086 RepID=UPI0012D3C037|nr:LacI family DNA-binding transcriptional regulator [Catellatospora paridis]